MKILIVEDEKLMVEQLRLYLRPIATHIADADELARALVMAKAERFTVVILDLKLVTTGKEEALLSVRHFKDLGPVVVVVSGRPDPNLKEEVEAAGADAFVPKDGSFSQRAMMIAMRLAVMKLPENERQSDIVKPYVELLERFTAA